MVNGIWGGGGAGPKFYKRYVDDIFAVFENESEAQLFLDYLNTRHPNIKFTKEVNINGILAFLDISISNFEGCKTSVYHKSTYTGLLTNFKCFVPHEYKKRLIITLLDRTFKFNSSWNGFVLHVKSLCHSLMRNMYPKWFIEWADSFWIRNFRKLSTRRSLKMARKLDTSLYHILDIILKTLQVK